MANAALITQDLVSERWRTAFMLSVGPQRGHSLETAARASGVPARTLLSYRDRESLPSFLNALRVMAVLGPEFAEAMLELAGLCGVREIAGDAPSPRRMLHDLASRIVTLANATERHGDIDHRHHAEVIAKFRALISELVAFVSGMEANAP